MNNTLPGASTTVPARMRSTNRARLASTLRAMRRKKRYYFYLMPIFALLLVFSYYPPISAFYYSLFDWDGVQLRYVGLTNFANLIQDDTFLIAAQNVLKLLVANIVIALVPSLIVAELIFELRNRTAGDFFRTVFLLPTLVPAMVVVLTWRFIYHPSYGLINTFLGSIGLGALQHDWLGSYETALPSLVFFGFPWVNGISVLILLAALFNISSEILDVYRLDGGGWGLTRLRYVDIPLIMGAIKLVLIMAVLGTLQGMTLQYAMTSGGPGRATNVPAYYMYQSAFANSQMGYASAIGVVLFAIVLVVTYLNMRFVRSSSEFDPTGGR